MFDCIFFYVCSPISSSIRTDFESYFFVILSSGPIITKTESDKPMEIEGNPHILYSLTLYLFVLEVWGVDVEVGS